MSLEDRAQAATNDAERWAVIQDAWFAYCVGGAGVFDWDYESRDLMTILSGQSDRP